MNTRLANELTEYQFAEEKNGLLEIIFLGVDNDGPLLVGGKKGTYVKIYVAEGDKLSTRTNVGFAAIGVGKSHAESQFMVAGYWPGKLLNEAILIAYSAKKRAESAPGVGKATDFISIGPKLGNFYKVEDGDLNRLDAIYAKSQKPAAQAFKRAILGNSGIDSSYTRQNNSPTRYSYYRFDRKWSPIARPRGEKRWMILIGYRSCRSVR